MNTQSAQPASSALLGELIDRLFKQSENGEPIDLNQLVQEYPEYSEQLRRVVPMLCELSAMDWRGENRPISFEDQLRTAEQRTLGDFRILHQIGRGGMGIVFEAQQLTINRKVALKILPLAALVDSRALQRFKNEVAAIATLQHPHIVAVYSIGEERGIHYFAMQLIRGQSLAAVIRELRARSDQDQRLSGDALNQAVSDIEKQETAQAASGSKDSRSQEVGDLDETKAETVARGRSSTVRNVGDLTYFRNVAQLVRQAAEALQHAHEHGIVHRDIKPGNLLLDSSGTLFITDFGLARIETGAGVTMTGDILGTLRYMSPEQVHGDRVVVDHRTDVYSLGATLYELLTLQPMLTGEAKAELIRKISFEEPTRPQWINPAIPTDLETIVLKAINKNPGDRYVSAHAFANDLQCFLDHRPIIARRPTLWKHFAKWSYRHRLLIATVALATLLSLGAGLTLAWSAYNQEAAQRARAQDNYRVAMRTLDDVIDNAAQMERMVDVEGWRRTTLERVLVHFAEFVDQNAADPAVKNELLKVREKQAKIHLLLENFPQAEAVALSGVDWVRADPASNDPVVAAQIWRRLAEAYHQQAKSDSAADAWQHGYDQIERVLGLESTKGAADALEIASFLRSYSQWQIECGSPGLALQSLRQAAEECTLAMKLEPQNQSAKYLLGEVTEDIADHYLRASNQSLATEHYGQALAITNELDDSRTHLELRAKCLRQMGTLLIDNRRTLADAEDYFRQSLETYEQLVRDYPWDIYYRGELVRLLHILAVALQQQGNNKEARELLERAAREQDFDTNKKSLRAEHQLFWAQQQWTLANVTRDLGQFELSKQHYELALDQLDKIGNRWSNYREIHENQALVHNDYAAMILAQPGVFGNVPVAKPAEAQIRQALEIFQKLQLDFPQLKRIDDQFPEITGYYSGHLRNTYTSLAKSLNAQQHYNEAEQALKQARAEFDRVPRLQSAKSRYEMANTMLDLAGTALMRDDDPLEVEKKYREGLQMITTAYAEDPGMVPKGAYTSELQTHYWGLAQALYEQERYAESKKEFERVLSLGPMWVEGLDFYAGHLLNCTDETFRDFRQALESYQEILKRGPSHGSRDNEFIGRNKLQIGICHFRLGEYKSAKRLFTELMTDSNYRGSFDFSLGYYMSMTLSLIDEADDNEGSFHKSEAREGYDTTLQEHQKLLENDAIPDDDIDQFERLRQEAADTLGIGEIDEARKPKG